MAKLNILSPWVIFYKKVDAMFKNDHGVHVLYDEDAQVIKLFVDDADKADALSQILPSEKEFGNVAVQLEVVPPNTNRVFKSSKENVFSRALGGNAALWAVVDTSDIPCFPSLTYVVFIKEVVQYYTDNLGDYNGMTSTLYQEIAKDIFVNAEGVYFCTNLHDSNIGYHGVMPL